MVSWADTETVWQKWPGLRRVSDVQASHENHFNLVRMLAATGVLVSHAYPLALGAGAAQPLKATLGLTLGTVCVYIFFAVSGFFIARSFDRTPSWRVFLRARVLRLFPALIMVTLLTVLFAWAVLSTSQEATFWRAVPAYVLRNITLVSIEYDLPGVFTDNPYGTAINGSLWTLFYEVVCYTGVLLAGLLGLFHRPRLFAVVLALTAAFCVFAAQAPLPGRLVNLGSLALPFAIGTALYVFRHHVPLSPVLGLVLAGLAVAAHGTPAFGVLFTLALSYGVFVIGYWPSDWLLGYNRLGDYSYGIYIYAFPVQQTMAWAGVASPWLNIALSLPVTVICAVLSWHLVEAPALRLKRRPAQVPAQTSVQTPAQTLA